MARQDLGMYECEVMRMRTFESCAKSDRLSREVRRRPCIDAYSRSQSAYGPDGFNDRFFCIRGFEAPMRPSMT
jgi:hypothetical protein